MLNRFPSQAIHHSASGFICGEKSFNAEFLQCNVQRRSQSSEGRKQAKCRVLPPVVDGQERWNSAIKIGHAPAARYARKAEQFIEETLQRLVCWIVSGFAMHPPNDACGDQFPVLNEGPQAFGIKDKTGAL